MKIFLLTCALLGLCVISQAQTVVRKNSTGSQMQIGQKATAADIYAVFGKPDKEYSHYDDAAGGNMVVCSYRDFIIRIVDGLVYNFGLSSDAYTVRIHDKYAVKVGMPIQTFQDLIPKSAVQIENREGYFVFWFKIPNTAIFSDESLVLTPDKQGLVRAIVWHVPE